MPDYTQSPSLSELEQLPFLTACINEGLRLASPVSHRINRIFPTRALDYHGTIIPAGSIVNMTNMLTHMNKTIFSEPHTFNPERWLGKANEDRRLEKYLTPFGRGTRSCLGLNLAKVELYLILANVFRRFDFDVSRVVRERDIDIRHDYIIAAQAKESPGILVEVRLVE